MVRECTAVWADPERANREVEMLVREGWKVKHCFHFRSKKDGSVELVYSLVR